MVPCYHPYSVSCIWLIWILFHHYPLQSTIFDSSQAERGRPKADRAKRLEFFFCHVFLFFVNFSDTVCNFGSELFSYSVVLKGLEKSESRGRFRGGRRRLGGCCFEGERSSSSGLKQPRTKPQLILMGAGRTVLAGREGKKSLKKSFY